MKNSIIKYLSNLLNKEIKETLTNKEEKSNAIEINADGYVENT